MLDEVIGDETQIPVVNSYPPRGSVLLPIQVLLHSTIPSSCIHSDFILTHADPFRLHPDSFKLIQTHADWFLWHRVLHPIQVLQHSLILIHSDSYWSIQTSSGFILTSSWFIRTHGIEYFTWFKCSNTYLPFLLHSFRLILFHA